MGEAEINVQKQQIIIHSALFFYGDAASDELSIQIARNIEDHWNEAMGKVMIKKKWYDLASAIQNIVNPAPRRVPDHLPYVSN